MAFSVTWIIRKKSGKKKDMDKRRSDRREIRTSEKNIAKEENAVNVLLRSGNLRYNETEHLTVG